MNVHRIWVFIEQQNGTVHPVAWELLGAAKGLADQLQNALGGTSEEVIVEGVVLGSNIAQLAEEAISFSADRVYLMDDPLFNQYLNAPYCKNITELVKKYAPEVFLIGATNLGRDLAGAVATLLETGLTADCTELVMGEVNNINHPLLLATRPAFGGNILATIVCRERLPQMASVRPRVFPVPSKRENAIGEIISEGVLVNSLVDGVEILNRIQTDKGAINIEYADIIVSGGRGLGDPSGFQAASGFSRSIGWQSGRYQTVC